MRSVGEVYLKKQQHGALCGEVVASMLEEADRMRQLIEGLLTLSRADAGTVKLKKTPEDLGRLVQEVTRNLEVLAEEKKQQLRLETGGPVPANVDPGILRHAIINLVDNAIKYSPEGADIRLRVRRRNGDALLEVEDQGPGIPEEHRAKIFDRFYRVDASRSRDSGGFGLGLSIARWAAEINGGSLELESHEGKGSTFRLSVPGQV
jgi:signal transduction histidine kinase